MAKTGNIVGMSVLIVIILVAMAAARPPLAYQDADWFGDPAVPKTATPHFGGDGMLEYDTSLFWSGMSDVEVRDSLAYCSMYNGLMILNVSNPSHPVMVKHLYLPEGPAMDIELAGNYIYLVDWECAFYVIDISNPAAPEIAGKYISPAGGHGIDIRDTLAFVAYGHAYADIGLMILNIKNPLNIFPVAKVICEEAYNGMLAVQTHGDYVYVVGDCHLWILDITDPASPTTVSRTSMDFYPVNLQLRDTILFLANHDLFIPAVNSAFSIYSIADPANPRLISQTDLWGVVGDVAVVDSIAYVANGEYGMVLYDISDLAAPDSLGTFSPGGGVMGKVAVSGDYAYLVDHWSEGYSEVTEPPVHFQIVNISDPADPWLAGIFHMFWHVSNVLYSNGYVYVLNNSRQDLDMIVVDVSGSPDSVGNYETIGSAEDGFIIDDTLYLAAFENGLEVIDISEPANPVRVRTYTAMGAYDVVVRDGYAYVGCTDWGFRIFDVTSPVNSPVVVLAHNCPCVGLYDHYLYVADIHNGLFIYDITDPANPVYVNKIGNSCGYFYISDHRLYWGQIYDLYSNPENPPVIGDLYDYPEMLGISTYGNYAITAFGDSGIKVLDVSDPQNIDLVFSCNTPSWARTLAVCDDYLFIADLNSLIVMKNQIVTDVESDLVSPYPDSYALHQNHPNPFNLSTEISFCLAEPGQVNIDIYNLLGRKIVTLADGVFEVGEHNILWDGRDIDGLEAASGIYFYRIKAGEYSETRKMMMLK